jgi:arylsulfatase
MVVGTWTAIERNTMSILQRLIFCFVFGLAGATVSYALEADSAPRPNIVMIMCDDMGFSDIGCYGEQWLAPWN